MLLECNDHGSFGSSHAMHFRRKSARFLFALICCRGCVGSVRLRIDRWIDPGMGENGFYSTFKKAWKYFGKDTATMQMWKIVRNDRFDCILMNFHPFECISFCEKYVFVEICTFFRQFYMIFIKRNHFKRSKCGMKRFSFEFSQQTNTSFTLRIEPLQIKFSLFINHIQPFTNQIWLLAI